jgi:DNA-binding transcriptional MerR regulator
VTAAGRSARDVLSIGAVLERLRREFPDVTISKIRFLESEGLLHPARSAAGYRQFTGADVERLRFVLTAQRDHYLPLKVIKQHLDAADSGEAQPRGSSVSERTLSPVAEVGTPADASGATARSSQLTRKELLAAAAMEDGVLEELERFGFVCSGSRGFYDDDALQVARTVQALGEFGIEPRHLATFRASVDREIALLEQVVAPLYRQRGGAARARADETVRELASLSSALHALLLKTGLTRR